MGQLMTIDEYMTKTFTQDSRPHINSVRRWIREGKLEAKKMGRSYYIEEKGGDEYNNNVEQEKMDAMIAKIING